MICEYKKSILFFDFWLGILIVSHFLHTFSKAHWPLVTEFHAEYLGAEGKKLSKRSMSHDQYSFHVHTVQNINFLLRN